MEHYYEEKLYPEHSLRMIRGIKGTRPTEIASHGPSTWMILTCWHATETCGRQFEKWNAVRQGITIASAALMTGFLLQFWC